MTHDGWQDSEDGTSIAAPGTTFNLPLTRNIHVSSYAIDLTTNYGTAGNWNYGNKAVPYGCHLRFKLLISLHQPESVWTGSDWEVMRHRGC
jgi:hypothetical protein